MCFKALSANIQSYSGNIRRGHAGSIYSNYQYTHIKSMSDYNPYSESLRRRSLNQSFSSYTCLMTSFQTLTTIHNYNNLFSGIYYKKL